MQSPHAIGRYFLFVLVLVLAVGSNARAQNLPLQPKIVSFQSGAETLKGYLWVPQGDGPYRAVLWNYGHSQPLLKQGPVSKFSELAGFYLNQNYVLFVPDRTGPEAGEVKGKKRLQDFGGEETDDIIAAIAWLRQQSFVDASRVAVSGIMSGAIHTMLAVERDATIRAAVVFSPASQTWDSHPDIQVMLERATDSTPVPMFLIQPQNDIDLGPSEVLGRMLSRKGGFNRSKIYPPVADPKMMAISGMPVWGRDVLEFLDASMK